MISSSFRGFLLSCCLVGLASCSSGPGSDDSGLNDGPAVGSGRLYNLVITQTVVTNSDKLGKLGELTYRAELGPDPNEPGSYIGRGTYSGTMTYTAANCLNTEPIQDTVNVSGDLEATASLFGENDENIVFNLNTTDWRWSPFRLDPEIYGSAANELSGGEDLEALRGLGSTASDLFGGMTFVGDTATNTRETETEMNPECTGRVTRHVTDTVQRVLLADKLKAVADITQVNWAGETAVLDGSRSTPAWRIDSYEWVLRPSPSCPPGVPTKTYNERIVEVKILCPMEAELTVREGSPGSVNTSSRAVSPRTLSPLAGSSSGGASDSTSAPVPFQKRSWKTKVNRQTNFVAYSGIALRHPSSGGTFLGRNYCAADGAVSDPQDLPNHWIHRKVAVPPSWEDEGYTLGTINDPKGPFHGWWYVKENKLEIHRSAFVQAELMNTSSETVRHNKNYCPAGVTCDIDLLIKQVKAHEKAHTDLVVKEIGKADVDPATKIEALTAAPEEGREILKKAADDAIQASEAALIVASAEANVKAELKKDKTLDKGGVVYVKDANDNSVWRPWNIANFAELGDE